MDHSPGCKCGACAAAADQVSQRSVHYRAGPAHRQCKDCSMFCPPAGNVGYGSCTHVQGKIGRLDTCDDFKSFKRM